ncbi:protein COFACTOR ASSEMBLY OF COMPLEX C SUBUNIT B CCB2, chloroplastic isoform X1 [Beta vulgaris subsp. vulgaris]|uniref:protein COFACTOR ASSEMBLY OF COMPLEX C SUBUNIT B CCB2, chloroplastic isoform X1 n=1 Tax=Beta vulgaris subsp. vulgaris TaxID=3555 RepID=UPI002549C0B7|nr:protein COFACTOR ASSEMBLY OF COMPLEX C SUBUNIT B CCB2, chloroplastic isoform X1 [Beta vulgaris subsp. vulgaris]
MENMGILTGNQLLPLTLSLTFRANYFHNVVTPIKTRRNPRKALKLLAKLDDSSSPTNSQQQVNLSVLRFTFGISWLDESYLPRWLGYGFGSLIILNHFVGSNSPVTSAQFISEALGLSLAAFSITLPYVGKFLKVKGAEPEELTTIPQRAQQIFVMSPNVSDVLKEDLAWTTYILLRNTKSVSVLISLQDVICIRGYWNLPENLSKDEILNWFMAKIKNSGLSDVEETLYFAQSTGSVLEKVIPEETGSILIQPFYITKPQDEGKKNVLGFVLVASSISYAYDDKDMLWIKAIANKLKECR